MRELRTYALKVWPSRSVPGEELMPADPRAASKPQALLDPRQLILPDLVDPLDENMLVRFRVPLTVRVLPYHVAAQQQLSIIIFQIVETFES